MENPYQNGWFWNYHYFWVHIHITNPYNPSGYMNPNAGGGEFAILPSPYLDVPEKLGSKVIGSVGEITLIYPHV